MDRNAFRFQFSSVVLFPSFYLRRFCRRQACLYQKEWSIEPTRPSLCMLLLVQGTQHWFQEGQEDLTWSRGSLYRLQGFGVFLWVHIWLIWQVFSWSLSHLALQAKLGEHICGLSRLQRRCWIWMRSSWQGVSLIAQVERQEFLKVSWR